MVLMEETLSLEFQKMKSQIMQMEYLIKLLDL